MQDLTPAAYPKSFTHTHVSPPHTYHHHTRITTTHVSPPHTYHHHTRITTTHVSPPHTYHHHTPAASSPPPPPPLCTCALQTHAFVKQAGAVMAWDRQILENRRFIVEVEGLLARAVAGQSSLEQKLSAIEASQKVGGLLRWWWGFWCMLAELGGGVACCGWGQLVCWWRCSMLRLQWCSSRIAVADQCSCGAPLTHPLRR